MKTIFITLSITCLVSCAPQPAEQNNAGNWYIANNQLDQARSAFQLALVAEPDNALIYFNAAQAFAQAGNDSLAIESFEQSIKRGDTTLQAQAFYNMGNLYASRDDYANAIRAYQQSLLLADRLETRHNLELVISMAQLPTPTPIEQQTRLEQNQVNPSITPTPNPAGENLPTPTPPPDNQSADVPKDVGDTGQQSDNQLATPVRFMDGQMSVEQAERILEETENKTKTMGNDFTEPTLIPSTASAIKDW